MTDTQYALLAGICLAMGGFAGLGVAARLGGRRDRFRQCMILAGLAAAMVAGIVLWIWAGGVADDTGSGDVRPGRSDAVGRVPVMVRYRVEPGSDVDRALDGTVREAMGLEPLDRERFALLDNGDEAHMIALGARHFLAVRGVFEAPEVEGRERAAWYGGLAPDGS